jgi:PD-(D/E)XK nuclease superfamily
MTAFRQGLRLQQARWRDHHGHPIGTHPFAPRPGDRSVRQVGSRIPLPYGRETGANLVTAGAVAAARQRTSFVEREQSFDHQRLWADLLSSEALAFNLFGDLAADLERADRAVHAWCPDAPGVVSEVRFAHSPGRLDPQWLNSLRAFDAAFVLDRGDGTHGILIVDVKYHERSKRETPKPANALRNREVHDRSGAFRPGVFDQLNGPTDLWWLWLEQLLLFSMLQHPSGAWTWGHFLVVHPAGNADVIDAIDRYGALLAAPSTRSSMTIEALLDSGTLPVRTTEALSERYVAG